MEANDPAEALAGNPLVGAYPATVVGIFKIRQIDGAPVVLADLPAIRSLAGEEVVDYPIAVIAADGRPLIVTVSSYPILENGKVVGALSIWHPLPARDSA